jgi:dTDP-4-dehydrorhamnose reductase
VSADGGPTLVLGAGGFLGVHAVEAALGAGLSVVATQREGRAGVARGEGHVERELDLLRRGALDELLREVAPARVLVCAALARVADCDRYPKLASELNEELPRRVAQYCTERGARLVHVSTDLVFGDRAPPPAGFAEEATVGPVSSYGATKAAGERAVLTACPAALVVRLPLLVGDSRGRGRGASDALLAAVARGERPPLFTDEWRTPLDVAAAARALVELLQGERAGILHVAGPERLSRHELGLRVLAAAGRRDAATLVRATTRAEAGRAERAGDVALDARRARAFLVTPLPPVP